jgi:hypothetical protein
VIGMGAYTPCWLFIWRVISCHPIFLIMPWSRLNLTVEGGYPSFFSQSCFS